jgi:beta-lactamase superfamily II metal-dependent hydrolase
MLADVHQSSRRCRSVSCSTQAKRTAAARIAIASLLLNGIASRSFPALTNAGDDVNENRIVVMLRYHVFRELFTGDAGEASEARLLSEGDDLHADALKAGHHGSRYASTRAFAEAVRPRTVVISVGRHNTFGHPAEATLTTWLRTGATVLRTDLCGAVILATGIAPATMLQCNTSVTR